MNLKQKCLHRSYLSVVYIIFLSQTLNGQFSIKGYVGGTISNHKLSFLKGTDLDLQQKTKDWFKSTNSTYVGVQIQKKYNKSIAFSLDLQSSTRGLKSKDNPDNYYKYVYIDFLPGLEFSLNKKFKIVVGPYFSRKIKELSTYPPIANGIGAQRLDYGMGASFSLDFHKLLLRAVFMHGLKNNMRGLVNFYTHRTFQLGLGYIFKRE